MISAFEIGKRAIMAQQRGLDVTSNNIANVNTPGYSRQDPILMEADPKLNPNGYVGAGVFADRVRQYRERFIDKEMRQNISRQAGYDTEEKTLQRIQTAINEPSDFGIDSAMDSFFKSIEDLNIKPDDIPRRETVIARANNLAGTFNETGERIYDLRVQTYNSLSDSVLQMNRLLGNIANLNVSIAGSVDNTGNPSGTFIDKQTQLLEELSKFGEVQISRSATGVADVTMNGTMVVSRDRPSNIQLRQTTNPTTGEITASLNIEDINGNILGSYKPATGALASLLTTFNVTLDDKDSSGGFSLAKSLDELASAFVDKVNSIAQKGYGLTDTGTTPPARNFFEVPANGVNTARSMKFNSAITDNPELLPVAGTANTPGNNSVMREIGQLINDSSFANGQSARGYYSTLLTKLSNIGADAKNGSAMTELAQNQLITQRESIIGVNLDEEAISMIKYQRAFEAAARVIQTSSDILNTIVNLGR
jgi:flagellar hook-associated protein 1